MNKIQRFAAVALLALAACEAPPHRGQFGEYGPTRLLMRLPGGDTVTVYRVKKWTFNSGEPPALQLEYALHGSIDDTAAIRRAAREIWPSFEPYARAAGVGGAILTATELTAPRGPVAVSRNRSFGMIAVRGPDGVWRFQGDSVPLPAGDGSGTPRIQGADGKPLPFTIAADS